MSGAINPSAIPGGDIDPDLIVSHANSVARAAARVRDNGAEVVTAWQGLSGVYEAPEAQKLFDVMTPVGSSTTQIGDQLETVAGALKQFAEEVRPIVAELKSLKMQAQTFVNTTVANGVTVRVPIPAGIYGTQPVFPTAYGSYGTTTQPAPTHRTEHRNWNEDQGAVDRNNDLLGQVNAQQVKLWDAERTCANTIRGLYGAASLHAATGENDANGYGIAEIPEGTEMPWGSAVERKEGCGEASVKFVFQDVLWEGIAVGGVWGTVTGLGSLTLGYNPATGDFFSGETYGQAWGGLGMLGVGLVAASPLGIAASYIPGPVGDFVKGGQEALVNTLKGVVAWDDWSENPGKALGTSIFNVGTIFIPAGAAVSGARTAAGAGRILTRAARVAEFVDPAAWAVRGGMSTLRFAGPPVLDALRALQRVDLDGLGSAATKIDIPDAGVGRMDWSPDGASTTSTGPSTGTGGVHSAPDGGNLGNSSGPGNGAAESGASGNSTSGSSASGNSTSGNSTSGSNVSGSNVSGSGAAGDGAAGSVRQSADTVGAPEPRPADTPAVREPANTGTDAPAAREPARVGAEASAEAPVRAGADAPAVREPASTADAGRATDSSGSGQSTAADSGANGAGGAGRTPVAGADGPAPGRGGGTDVLDRPATGHPDGGGTRADGGGQRSDGDGTRPDHEGSSGAGDGAGAGGARSGDGVAHDGAGHGDTPHGSSEVGNDGSANGNQSGAHDPETSADSSTTNGGPDVLEKPGSPGDGQVDSSTPYPPSEPFPDSAAAPASIEPALVDSTIVQQFNPRTAPDEVVFWSGRVDDGAGDFKSVMDGAGRLARDHHGLTLEQILESQGMLDKMPSDWAQPSTIETWRAVSSSLADEASGTVRAYVGDVRPTSVWVTYELPRLLENPKVTSIQIIDAYTGKVVKVYGR